MQDEWKDIFEQQARKTLEQWEKHKFQLETDEQLFLLLKGHLLIEEKLDMIIAVHFGDEGLSKALNLRFHQKVKLAEAICTQYFKNSWWNPYIWPAINLLNQARNELAHKLESEKIATHVAGLLKLYDGLGQLHEQSFEKQTGKALPRLSGSLQTNEIKLRALIVNILNILDQLTVGLVALDKVIVDAILADGANAMNEAMSWMRNRQSKLRLKESVGKLVNHFEASDSEDVPPTN